MRLCWLQTLEDISSTIEIIVFFVLDLFFSLFPLIWLLADAETSQSCNSISADKVESVEDPRVFL